MSSRKTGGHEPGCGGFACRDLMFCVQWSIWMFGIALWLMSVTPSTSQPRGTSDPVLVDPGAAACGPIAVSASARHSLAITCRINRVLIVARSGRASSAAALAYVVSPPPATREVMPRYLPRLPPEDAARIPQVATRSARRLRTGCRCGHLRPRHARRCTHCRHRAEHLGAPRRCRHAGHCATHPHGRSELRRWRPHRLHRKAVNGINGQGGDRVTIAAAFRVAVLSALRRWHGTLGFRERSSVVTGEVRGRLQPWMQSEPLRIETVLKKVDIPINAWPPRAFPAAI
jgi:hypothetical protein